MLCFEGVTKSYGQGPAVLSGVDLDLASGEFAFLLGRSGAGKSTLLRLVYREEQPTSGRVWVGGRQVGTLTRREVPFLRRLIGVVCQDGRLLANRTVWDNVAYPLLVADAPPRESFQRIADALRAVGMAHRAWKHPAALSGGERQRVAIARAIVADPLIVLADEPTGNLDPRSAQQVMQILLEVSRGGTTVLVATHAHELVERTGERVLTLEDGRLTEGWAGVPRPAGPRPAAATRDDAGPWTAAAPRRSAVPTPTLTGRAPYARGGSQAPRVPYPSHAALHRPAAAVAHAVGSPPPAAAFRRDLRTSPALHEATASARRPPAAGALLVGTASPAPPRRLPDAHRLQAALRPSRRSGLPGALAWLPGRTVAGRTGGLRGGAAALLRLAAVARRTASAWTARRRS